MSPFTFLLCSERSGSNLITRIFDSHSKVCGPPPTHFVRQIFFNRIRYGDLNQDANWSAMTEDVACLINSAMVPWKTSWSGEQLRESCEKRKLTELIKATFLAEAAAAGKDRVFIKENEMHHLAPLIFSGFPDANVLFFVRDPRDMVLSHMATPSRKGDIASGAQIWQNDQRLSLRLYHALTETGTANVVVLRYEDLLQDAENQLKRVCSSLGLDYEPQMLAFGENATNQALAGATTAWKNLSKPLLSGNHKKYRQALHENQIRYIESVCWDEMEALGYQPDFEKGKPADLLDALKEAGLERMPGPACVPEEEVEHRKRVRASYNQVSSRTIYPII
jgi:hypothetical protein